MEITCQDVKQKLDSGEEFLLLDCREQNEYELVHLENSSLMPMSEIVDRFQELTEYQAKPVVVYCHHGGRSLQVTQYLRQQGFTDVLSMAGGIDRWSQEIDPTLPRY